MNEETLKLKIDLLIESQQKMSALLRKQTAQVAALTATCSTLIAASPVRKEAAALLAATAHRLRQRLTEPDELEAFDATIMAVTKFADRKGGQSD